MDAAFNTLMIPPVQCAYHMPPLPDEQSKEKSQLSEPERLFLRWWSTLDKLRMSLMVAYERVILEDLEFCNTAHVEQGMWKSVFYTVLESLRVWIANPYMTGYVFNLYCTMIKRITNSDALMQIATKAQWF